MSAVRLALLAALGSLLLLAGALGFQYIGGLAPCQMCYWQRWPHAAAVAFGLGSALFGGRVFAIFGALAAGVASGLGAFHAGVEQKWWPGPGTCSGTADLSGKTADQMLADLLAAPVTRCDEIAWQLGGISMAGWNAILSACLMGLWCLAVWQSAHRT